MSQKQKANRLGWPFDDVQSSMGARFGIYLSPQALRFGVPNRSGVNVVPLAWVGHWDFPFGVGQKITCETAL
jgi:hypothetical protein